MSLGNDDCRRLVICDKIKGFALLLDTHGRDIGDFLITEDYQTLLLGIFKIAGQLQTGAVGIRYDDRTLQRSIITGYLYKVKILDERSDLNGILFFHMLYPFSSTFFRY